MTSIYRRYDALCLTWDDSGLECYLAEAVTLMLFLLRRMNQENA